VRLAVTLLAHEARIQLRSLRFRVVATLFLALTAVAPVLTFLRREAMSSRIGAATYPAETMVFLPPAVLIVAFLLSVDGLTRERHQGAWSTLSLAPFSNAGWVLGRFLALWTVTAVLGALPLGLGAALAKIGGAPVEPWAFVLPWLLQVAPVAALGVAAGLACGAVGDGAVPGIALLLLAITAGGSALAKLGRWGFEHGLSDQWLGWRFLDYRAGRVLEAVAGEVPRYWWEKGMPFPASEAPLDVPTDAAGHVPYLIPCLALGLLSLAVAPRLLRRSRRDLPPWKVGPDHPLRSFVALAARLRDRYAPDPRLGPRDRRLAIVLVAAGLLSYGFLAQRASERREVGRDRWHAERTPPPVMSPSVVPGAWSVTGSLCGRFLELEVEAEMENRGAEPASRLTFALNPGLEIEILGSESPEGVSFERDWDRVSVIPSRELAPGESRPLRFTLRGEPTTIHFSLGGRTFQQGFHHFAKKGGLALGLAPSRREPRVSPRWTELGPGNLYPLPRYTPWDLVAPQQSWQGGRVVPPEMVDPRVDLTIRIAVECPGLELVDSCGARVEQGKLESACSLPVGSYALVGGRREWVEGRQAFLVVPSHAGVVEALRRDLSRAGERIAAAWPEGERAMEVRERLLILGEESFVAREPLPPDELASVVLGSWLSRRRSPVPEEAFLQRWLLETLAERRVSPRQASSAILPANRAGAGLYAVDLSAVGYPAPQAERRLAALLATLEGRLGPAVLRAGVEVFLSGSGPGRLEELFEILGRESGQEAWTGTFYREYLRGKAVPQLALTDVTFSQDGKGWTARGRVVNEGDGALTCPVTLTTEIAPVTTEVEIPSGGSASFVLSSPYRPQAVFLDPEESCLRYRPLNARERVDFEAPL
jgi:hypothetical protein